MKRRDFLRSASAAAGLITLAGCEASDEPEPEPEVIEDVDVAVVGGGLSGLVAARTVLAGGRSVRLLEARDRVGGRTFNQAVAGAVVEGGGQWVGPTQTELLALADELGVATFATYNTGQSVLMFDGFRFTSDELPADPAEEADIERAIDALDALAATVPLDRPWAAPDATALDGQTAAAWIAANTSTTGARLELELGVASVLGSPERLSLLWTLFFVHAAGGFRTLGGIEGAAQDSRFVGGSQEIALRLAEELGAVVRTGTPVDRIEDLGDRVLIQYGSQAVRCQRAIIAMSPADANRLDISPLPANRESLQNGWGTTSGFKVHVAYDRPFWRDAGLSGQAVSDTAVELTFDNSPPSGSPGVLLAFVNGDRLAANSATRRQQVVDRLVDLFGQDAREPLDYAEMNWSDERYNVGCGPRLPPGLLTDYGAALRAPAGRLHWAGTETAMIWNGYMEGAVRAGRRAAEEVLAAS